MTNKDKIAKHETYIAKLKNSLEAPTPAKHVNSPETYKAFLKNELRIAQSKLDALKLVG